MTALFAFLHFPQGAVIPMAVLGAVTAGITLATGSVLGAVLVHMAWNAVALTRGTGTTPETRFLIAVVMGIMLVLILQSFRPLRTRRTDGTKV